MPGDLSVGGKEFQVLVARMKKPRTFTSRLPAGTEDILVHINEILTKTSLENL